MTTVHIVSTKPRRNDVEPQALTDYILFRTAASPHVPTALQPIATSRIIFVASPETGDATMPKSRDGDAQLKALHDKENAFKQRKVLHRRERTRHLIPFGGLLAVPDKLRGEEHEKRSFCSV